MRCFSALYSRPGWQRSCLHTNKHGSLTKARYASLSPGIPNDLRFRLDPVWIKPPDRSSCHAMTLDLLILKAQLAGESSILTGGQRRRPGPYCPAMICPPTTTNATRVRHRSNAKKIWAAAKPMNCEELLVRCFEMRVFIVPLTRWSFLSRA